METSTTTKASCYRRVLLKLSGEALTGEQAFGIHPNVLQRIVNEVGEVVSLGVEVAMVVGGGNLFRGRALSEVGLDRVTADHMGMLATVMNAMALRDMFEQAGLESRVLSALSISGLVDTYYQRKALHHLKQGRVVIFSGGTGNPFVTTDSAASLRGIEINADVVLKATSVDGIYSADPKVDANATMYQFLTYQQALDKELGVMDLAAFCQCRDYQMPLRIFNINKPGALLRIMRGEQEGTLVALEESQ